MAGRRQRGELFAELAFLVEQFICPVALHPFFKLFEMLGIRHVRNRDLMRAPGAFDRQAVDEFRPGPALGRTKHYHWPTRPFKVLRLAARSCATLDLTDLKQNPV